MFSASEHLSDIKGKAYLEVKWRLVWFREEKPTWSLETELVSVNEKGALFKALVKDDTGRVIATAHKSETPQGFADFIEKAETGAVGRALALVGYGTQFAPDLEEGNRLADSPVERKTPVTIPPFASTAKSSGDNSTRIKYLYKLWHEQNLDVKAENKKLTDKYGLMGLYAINDEDLENEISIQEKNIATKDTKTVSGMKKSTEQEIAEMFQADELARDTN